MRSQRRCRPLCLRRVSSTSDEVTSYYLGVSGDAETETRTTTLNKRLPCSCLYCVRFRSIRKHVPGTREPYEGDGIFFWSVKVTSPILSPLSPPIVRGLLDGLLGRLTHWGPNESPLDGLNVLVLIYYYKIWRDKITTNIKLYLFTFYLFILGRYKTSPNSK